MKQYLKKSLFCVLTICLVFGFTATGLQGAEGFPVFASAAGHMPGDVDRDNVVSAADARLTLRASVGLEFFDGEQNEIADVDSDGNVTAADARLILRASVGLEHLSGQKKAKLVMGTNAAFPPYEFISENGSYTGIDIEIAQAVADELGFELVIKDMEFDSLIPAVSAGAVDFVMAGITETEERSEYAAFSDPYWVNTQVVLVRNGSNIRSVDDLFHATIGVIPGTTGDIYATDEFGQENVRVFQSYSFAAQALRFGQIDAVILDQVVALNIATPDSGLTIMGEYVVEGYAAAFSRGNTELLDLFNAALKKLSSDGTILKIAEAYFPGA